MMIKKEFEGEGGVIWPSLYVNQIIRSWQTYICPQKYSFSALKFSSSLYTGLPWDSWPKKSGYQLFGGRFWIFQSFRSQGRRMKLGLSKHNFKFCPEKLLNCVLYVKKWAKNWWNCKKCLVFTVFGWFCYFQDTFLELFRPKFKK